MLTPRRALACLTALLMTGGSAVADSTATETARAYFAAMELGDLDAAERLFASQSSVFETGGAEGGWPQYREHHIGPELGRIESFEIERGEPEEVRSTDGTKVLVAWPIDYQIQLDDGRSISSRGTVTFVLVAEEGACRIRHLHWSSRRKKA